LPYCVTCIGPGEKPSLQVHSKPPSTLVQVPLPQIFFTDMHSLSSGIKDTNLLLIYQFYNVSEVTEVWITRSEFTKCMRTTEEETLPKRVQHTCTYN